MTNPRIRLKNNPRVVTLMFCLGQNWPFFLLIEALFAQVGQLRTISYVQRWPVFAGMFQVGNESILTRTQYR